MITNINIRYLPISAEPSLKIRFVDVNLNNYQRPSNVNNRSRLRPAHDSACGYKINPFIVPAKMRTENCNVPPRRVILTPAALTARLKSNQCEEVSREGNRRHFRHLTAFFKPGASPRRCHGARRAQPNRVRRDRAASASSRS